MKIMLPMAIKTPINTICKLDNLLCLPVSTTCSVCDCGKPVPIKVFSDEKRLEFLPESEAVTSKSPFVNMVLVDNSSESFLSSNSMPGGIEVEELESPYSPE